MLKLPGLSKSKHSYASTSTLTIGQRLNKTVRSTVLAFGVLALAFMPLFSLPTTAQSSLTGLSTTSGPSVGGTEVTFSGQLEASFKQVSAGEYHSLGLTVYGEVYAWGANWYGQLGDGTTTDRLTPTVVTALSGQIVTNVVAGWNHSVALTSNGEVYAWGENWAGQLGDGTIANRSTPALVTNLSDQTIIAIAAGGGHSFALTNTGAVYAWGYNGNGQLGDGTTTQRSTPTLVTALSGQTVTAVAAGSSHSLALTSTGAVYAWGYNYNGQLGDGTTTQRLVPTVVTALSDQTVTALAAGGGHTSALTSTGTVYAWGANNQGQLGDGTTTQRLTPTLVTALNGQTITAISTNFYHALALTNTGSVYAWGNNISGQLGDGTTTQRNTPTLVTSLNSQVIVAIADGWYHTLAITINGDVYTWGYNGDGMLGDNTTEDRLVPTSINTSGVSISTPTVTFGGLPATNVEIIDGPSGKQLKAVTPAHVPGVVDVVVTFPGEEAITLTNAYTYLPTTTVVLSGIASPVEGGIAPALASGSLSAAGACNNIAEPSVALLSSAGATAPSDVSLYGGVGFSLYCASSGQAATISIDLANIGSNATALLPAINSSNIANLRAYKSQGSTLIDITGQTTFTLGTDDTVRASYELIDGGELDEDGVANGTIVDPVYIGYYNATTSTLADTGASVNLLVALGGSLAVVGVAAFARTTKQ